MANENKDIGEIVKKCKILLLDIEGTTTSISFVKVGLTIDRPVFGLNMCFCLTVIFYLYFLEISLITLRDSIQDAKWSRFQIRNMEDEIKMVPLSCSFHCLIYTRVLIKFIAFNTALLILFYGEILSFLWSNGLNIDSRLLIHSM